MKRGLAHSVCYNAVKASTNQVIFGRKSQKKIVFVFIISVAVIWQGLKIKDLLKSGSVMGVCPCLVELMLLSNKGASEVHELVACSSAR